MIGTTISHYKILEKLGEGGMGVVYRAQDTKLHRFVALKFLPAHLSASEVDKARFLREARAAASLNHPNICTIYGIEEHEGQIFIAMELVEGKTLRQQNRSFSVKQAIDIGVQIAEGLAAAHEKGIVHRDIKPENIMIRKDGIALIMDFGLAKLRSTSSPQLTLAGNMVGTMGYMSPEQVQGQEVDHRSDIFSLGILLYELLAGQAPFKGIHNAALMYEIVSVDPPPLWGMKPEMGPEINRVIMECLHKDPADRFQSPAEVAKELRRLQHTQELSRKNLPSRTQKDQVTNGTSSSSSSLLSGVRWLVRLMFIALGVGLSAAVYFLWRTWEITDSHGEPVERFALPLPAGGSLELRRDGMALSPDGKHLALIVRQDSSSFLYLRDLDQLEMKPVVSTAGLDISGVFFSPDGQWLGFFANGKLMKLSLQGGTPVTICDALRGDGDPGGEASWGEGGNIVFMKEWGGSLWIVSSEAGSVPRPLTKLNAEAGERTHFLPRVLPGGTKALFTIWRGGDFNENIVAAIDLKSGEYHAVLNGGTGGTYLKTGHLVYMVGSTLMAVPFDATKLKMTGEPLPVIEKVLMNGGDAYPYFSVSDNGLLAFAPGEVEFIPTVITLVEHGSPVRRIEAKGANIGFPLFSPDGKFLSVIIFGSTFQLGVFDLQKNVLTPLTFSSDNVRDSWLPDGSRISFSSNVDGRYKIYTVAADGSGPPQKLFDSDANPYPSSWTHDSKTLAYVAAGQDTGFDIWLYSGTASPATRPLIATRANEVSPSFSPDDHWLAYVSDETGRSEVYVQPFPSMRGRWRVSTVGGTNPQWTPDGHNILFMRNDEILSVPVTVATKENGQTIGVGREERFLVRKGLIIYDLSRNGKIVAIGQTKTESLVDHVNIVVNWYAELKEKFASRQTTTVR